MHFAFTPLWAAVALACSVSHPAAGASAPLLEPEAPSLRSLDAFRSEGANWRIAGGLKGDPRIEKILTPAPGTGVLINTAAGPGGSHLFSSQEHGDIDLELEFLVPMGANSGVYLQGRYEVQIFDSWGSVKPGFSDAGGIYERWDSTRPEGRRGFEGHAPRIGVSRAPGLWQQLRIVFRAPRFDESGRKTANARFVRVEYNGVRVHENVEVTGPTRSAAFEDERPTGPLMLQGDHGSVAFRNLRYTLLGGPAPAAKAVRYRVFEGAFQSSAELDGRTPTREGDTTTIDGSLAGMTAPHALVIDGELTIATAGTHGFALNANGIAELSISGETVLTSYGSEMTTRLNLAAGLHPFRLVYLHNSSRGSPQLEWRAAGPGADPQAFTAGRPTPRATTRPDIEIEPEPGRVRVQRTFFPFEPHKRVYAMVVGFDARRNFAYDLAEGCLLAVWTGTYVDATAMWRDRGNEQIARPTGAVIAFDGQPSLAGLGNPAAGWPPAGRALLKPRGYTLEADGLPVFHYDYGSARVSDRIALRADGRGLDRTITISGEPLAGQPYLLIAEDTGIVSRPGGYVVGERRYYVEIDERAGAPKPLLRTDRERRQLIVPLGNQSGERAYRYSLVW